MSKKCTKGEFIKKSVIIHGDKFDYSKVDYINSITKIIIICKVHGEFSMTPDNHINQKQGCRLCGIESRKVTKISEKRLIKLQQLHNNHYEYNDLSVNDGYITIKCPIHGDFTQLLVAHERGNNCKQCAYEKRGKAKNLVINGYKICKECKQNKPIDIFKLKKIKNEYRFTNTCIECFKIVKANQRKIYNKNNKDKKREFAKRYHTNRLKRDLLYKTKIIARNVIRKSLSKMGYTKKSKTYEIIGCSYEEFKKHIENLFLEGMNWDNRNKWQIDHIIPLSFAISEDECIKLNHYKNLRPLWNNDNLIKSNFVDDKSELYLNIISNRI